MNKTVVLIVTFAFLLVSCASNTAEPAASPTLPPTTTVAPLIPSVTAPAATPAPETTPSVVPTVAFSASPPAACQTVPVVPPVDTLARYDIPASREDDHAYGAADAKVTILSYCNYQKAACKTLIQSLTELQQIYQDELRVVLRQFPQPDVDDKSLIAAHAAEAAALENRYWEMNNLLYSRQSEWLDLSPDEFTSWLTTQAGSLKISPAQWESNMTNETVLTRVAQTIADATSLQLSSTPFLFFNNILVKTSLDMDSLSVLVDYFLLPEKAYSACPAIVIDSSKTYTATFTTEKGAIVIDLFNDIAPVSVNSFVTLARAGWYDGSAFFRVIPGFVAQGGDPSNSGLGTPGYGISAEVDPSLRFDAPGLLALNQNSDGLSGSQFFITYTPLPEMDGRFTIIGRVIEGMSVVNSLRPRNPESDEILLPADVLVSVTIEEN